MTSARTIGSAIGLGALMYLPAVGLRYALSPGGVAGAGGLPAPLLRCAAYGTLGLMALVAMAAGAARGGGWRRFGFCAARPGWGRYAAVAAICGIASGFLIKLGHGTGLDATVAGIGAGLLLAMVVFASIVEELFVRGWMMGFLEPIAGDAVKVGRFALSVRVLIGAAFFATMHLTLAASSIDALTMTIILAFTFLLGVLCGTTRERSGSLLAAILTHLAGNAGGLVGGILYVIATNAPPTS
jgi:membrane protease YdiL (CAAX protease family)